MVKVDFQSKEELTKAIERLNELKLKSKGANLKAVKDRIKTYEQFLNDLNED